MRSEQFPEPAAQVRQTREVALASVVNAVVDLRAPEPRLAARDRKLLELAAR